MSKTSFVFFYLIIVSFILACAYAEKKTENSTQPERESIIPYHAFGLFVIWSVLVELPLFAIKKLKSPTIHLALFAILDLSTLCSVGFVVVEKWEKIILWNFKSTVGMAHCIFGIVVPCLIVLQHLLGFLTLNKSNSATPIHKKMGYFLYYLTKVSVLTGSFMFDQRLFYGAIIGFTVIFVLKSTFSQKNKGKKQN